MSMSGSNQKIIKTVEIEVPRRVAERALERAGEEENVEEFLLDEFNFEYEWTVESGRRGDEELEE